MNYVRFPTVYSREIIRKLRKIIVLFVQFTSPLTQTLRHDHIALVTLSQEFNQSQASCYKCLTIPTNHRRVSTTLCRLVTSVRGIMWEWPQWLPQIIILNVIGNLAEENRTEFSNYKGPIYRHPLNGNLRKISPIELSKIESNFSHQIAPYRPILLNIRMYKK